MQHLKALPVAFLLACQVFALPTKLDGRADFSRVPSLDDADEAIAYAWFNEDDNTKRSASGNDDADEAIAYAWFNEDDNTKRSASGSDDADEAIAYAWFNED